MMRTSIFNKKYFLSFFLSYSFFSVIAQVGPDALNLSEGIMGLNNKPTSQFGKPALGTSDLYTGMATYSVPLFELKSRDLKVPVSLNYASGGVRVGEIGGWLGMSWRLNAGGEISREMKGYPDEMPGKGYFAHGANANYFINKTNEEKINIIKNSQKEGYDFQPDVFHYSFAGESGYFVFDNIQSIYTIPRKNWKITKTIDPVKKTISSFEVITDNGIKYIFGRDVNAIEETKLSTLKADAIWDFNRSLPDLPTCYILPNSLQEKLTIPDFYTSKWYLAEIVSPTSDKITFEYEDAGLATYVNAPQILSYEDLTALQYHQDTAYYYIERSIKPHELVYSFLNAKSPESTTCACPTCTDQQCCDFDYPLRKLIPIDGPPGTNWTEPEPFPFPERRNSGVIPVPVKYYLHQTRIEAKTKILTYIRSLGNDYIYFSHDPSNTLPGMCRINSISLKDKENRLVKSFTLSYKKVVSNSANPTGVYPDPFSIFELEAFGSTQIPKPGSEYVPANLAQNYLGAYSHPNKGLMDKYVAEGIKSYNYERYFLEKIQEVSASSLTIPPYSFTYDAPEKIIRRTSVWSGILNFSIPESIKPSQVILKLVESYNYQVSDGFYKPEGTSFGQLKRADLPTGGSVEYEFEDTKNGYNPNSKLLFGVKRVSKIHQSDGAKTSTKEFKYLEIGHKALYQYSRDISYYSYGNMSEYRKRITTSYEMDETDLTKGSPIGYKVVEVRDCSDGDCNSNGYQKFEFTTLSESDLNGISEVNRFGKAYSYPTYLGVRFKCFIFDPGCANLQDEYLTSERVPVTDNVFSSSDYSFFSSIDFARGLLKHHLVYNGFNLVKETLNYYKITEKGKVIGLSGMNYDIAKYKTVEHQGGWACEWDTWSDPKILTKYIANLSIHSSSQVFLTSTSEKIIDQIDPNKYNEILREFSSTTLNQVKDVSQNQSDGLKIITEYTYPTDISFGDHPSNCYEYASIAERAYNERRTYCNNQYTTDEGRLSCLSSLMATQYPTCYDQNTGEYLYQSCVDNCTITPLDAETNAISAMVSKNIINTPLQTVTKKGEGIIAANYLTYNIEHGMVLPKVSNAIEIKDPIPSVTALSVNSSGQLVKDFRYVPKDSFDVYDNKGNLLQYHQVKDINNSFIWGYNKTLPTAKVINAKSNQIAYTSFEDNTDYGNWQPGGGTVNANIPAKTGKKYLEMYGTNVLQYSFAEAGKYKLEYWSTAPITFSSNSQLTIRDISTSAADANGWVLYIKEITVAAPTSMGFGATSAKIDEVRLYPAAAQMTTYTYDPLIGMTSETNEKNVTTYYEYDSFGRLSVVRDQDRNIVKTYDYHYKE